MGSSSETVTRLASPLIYLYKHLQYITVTEEIWTNLETLLVQMPEVEEDVVKLRKSSLVTGRNQERKKSFVSFDDKKETIEVSEKLDEVYLGEEGDTLNRLSSEEEPEETEKQTEKVDNKDEEEEEEVPYTRRWTDSLKIKRRKNSKHETEVKDDEKNGVS